MQDQPSRLSLWECALPFVFSFSPSTFLSSFQRTGSRRQASSTGSSTMSAWNGTALQGLCAIEISPTHQMLCQGKSYKDAIRTSGSVTVNASNPKSGTWNPNDIPSPVSAMSSNTLDSEINYGGAFWQMIQKFADKVTDYSIKHNIFLEDSQKLVSRWYSHSVFAKRQALTLNR